MEKLPNEILEVIFDNIDEAGKKPVREVCSKWYDMNEMGKMVIKYKNDDQERIIQDICKIKPKELVFSYCHDIPGRFSIKEILDAIFETDIVLEVLKIEHCYFQTEKYENLELNNLRVLIITDTYMSITCIKSNSMGLLKIRRTGLSEIELECPMLHTIDLSENSLTEFSFSNDELIYLDLCCTNLHRLELDTFYLQHLDLEYNMYLEEFNVIADCLTDLKLMGCSLVTDQIDYNKYDTLKYLNVSETGIEELDISDLNLLESLDLSFTKNLFHVDLSNNTNLKNLRLYESSLHTIDLSANKKLVDIDASNTPNLIIDTSHLSLKKFQK